MSKLFAPPVKLRRKTASRKARRRGKPGSASADDFGSDYVAEVTRLKSGASLSLSVENSARAAAVTAGASTFTPGGRSSASPMSNRGTTPSLDLALTDPDAAAEFLRTRQAEKSRTLPALASAGRFVDSLEHDDEGRLMVPDAFVDDEGEGEGELGLGLGLSASEQPLAKVMGAYQISSIDTGPRSASQTRSRTRNSHSRRRANTTSGSLSWEHGGDVESVASSITAPTLLKDINSRGGGGGGGGSRGRRGTSVSGRRGRRGGGRPATTMSGMPPHHYPSDSHRMDATSQAKLEAIERLARSRSPPQKKRNTAPVVVGFGSGMSRDGRGSNVDKKVMKSLRRKEKRRLRKQKRRGERGLLRGRHRPRCKRSTLATN